MGIGSVFGHIEDPLDASARVFWALLLVYVAASMTLAKGMGTAKPWLGAVMGLATLVSTGALVGPMDREGFAAAASGWGSKPIWTEPWSHHLAESWGCFAAGLGGGLLVACSVMAVGLLIGPIPNRRERLVTAALAASSGSVTILLFCPADHWQHILSGHLPAALVTGLASFGMAQMTFSALLRLKLKMSRLAAKNAGTV
jgi:hypothetical protein